MQYVLELSTEVSFLATIVDGTFVSRWRRSRVVVGISSRNKGGHNGESARASRAGDNDETASRY